MVAMVGVIDSRRLVAQGLWDYRPLFLVGKKASKSAYQLIEEIFNESVKQNTPSPIIAKQTLASRLAVSDKTIQRNSKILANTGQISYTYLGNGYYQYQLLYQGNFPLPESCFAYDSEQLQPSGDILPVATGSLPISLDIPSATTPSIIDSSTTITPATISTLPLATPALATPLAATPPAPTTPPAATLVTLAPVATQPTTTVVAVAPATTPTNTATTPAPEQQTTTASLPYTEEQINEVIENLSEKEQDSLIDKTIELLNQWDVTRASELTAIRKRCKTQAFYEQYIYDMAAAEVNRRYAVSLLTQKENNQSHITNDSEVTNQTVMLDHKMLQGKLVPSDDHNHLDTNVQANNIPTSLNSELHPKDKNVHPQDNDPINQTTSLDILELGHKCPPLTISLTISLFTGLKTQVTSNITYTHIEITEAMASYSPTHTQSQLHAHACVHARVREEKDLREVKVNKVIYNFLTSTFLGSESEEKEHGSGTNTSVDNNTNTRIITDLIDSSNTSNQTQPTNTSSQVNIITDINSVNTINTTSSTTNSSNSDNSITSNTANAINEVSQPQTSSKSSNKSGSVIDLTTRKSISRSDNKSSNDTSTSNNINDGDVIDSVCEDEVIDPARIERRRLDEKISSNDFALWRIVNGDRKIKQDEDGNYLLPNELNNYPKSTHSFWDILAYAQTQKSLKTPAGFSVGAYYSGKIDNSPTFQKYLEEKANSLIGGARKPTEPTQAEKSVSAKLKQDLDYQLMLNDLGEELWQNLSSDEQQSLIAQEIEKLKTSEFFHSHYKNWPKSQLQDHAIHKVKKQLAKAEMCRRERLETGMSLAS